MNSLEFARLLAIRLLLSQHDHMNLLYSQGIEKVQSKSIRMLYQYTKKYMKMGQKHYYPHEKRENCGKFFQWLALSAFK